jgi:tRNA A-37 threonylcarbamoyl transferase component Bud32
MDDCLPSIEKPYRTWFLKNSDQIGEKSKVGKVYQICDSKQNCDYVMKVLRPRYKDEDVKVKKDQEVVAQNVCSQSNLCLKVEDSWDCKNTAVIVTKMAKETLYSYISNNLNIQNYDGILVQIQNAFILIKKLHFDTMIHQDTHLNNFMLTFDDRLVFIDLGSALFFNKIEYLFELKRLIVQDYYYFISSLEDFFYGKDETLDLIIAESKKVYFSIHKKIEYYFQQIDFIFDKNYKSFDTTVVNNLDDDDIENIVIRFARITNKISIFDAYSIFFSVENNCIESFLKIRKIELKENLPEELDEIPSPCRPENDNDTYSKNCSFTGGKLIPPSKLQLYNIRPFQFINEKRSEEFYDYLNEFSVFVLKKGTKIIHATNTEITKLTMIGNDTVGEYVLQNMWWVNYYPGQSHYKGGWFTYETKYGGPQYFGLYLYYEIQKDLPLLYIPNYNDKLGSTNEYIDPTEYSRNTNTVKYKGSHVIQGVKGWKKKGYQNVQKYSDYFADGIAYNIADLGFNGYITCDECEIFISHEAMKNGYITRPYLIDTIGDSTKPPSSNTYDVFIQKEYEEQIQNYGKDEMQISNLLKRNDTYQTEWKLFKTHKY